MEFEVVQFKLHTNANSIGKCLISYGNLLINCDLVYYKPEKKAWIRMPEKWVWESGIRRKEQYCFWKNKEESDKFQVEILKVLEERHGLNIDKIILMYDCTQIREKNSRQLCKK